MTIKGNTVTVQKSVEELYAIFTELNHFKKLIPASNQKFEIHDDSLLFQLKGMPEIRLAIKEKVPFSKVVLQAVGGKFPFTLEVNINSVTKDESTIQLIFEGSFNPMMAMMIKKPLTQFITVLTQNIKKL